MTKKKYLEELKSKISSLTQEQIDETIQYYSDYFDDANNDQKIMNELGTTDQLAEKILQKYNSPVNQKTAEEKSQSADTSNTEEENLNAFYSFSKGSVKNLYLNFGAANVVAIPGKNFCVETRGIDKECIICSLSENGTLNIYNNKRINFNFWSHEQNSHIVPRILITIPENAHLDNFKINLGEGKFLTKGTSVFCDKGLVQVGAGNLVVSDVFGGAIDFRCGMGNLEMEGKLSGKCNIDCGMGCIKLVISGNETDYSSDVKVGLGDFTMNSFKKSGVGQKKADIRKDNHFSVNVGMGSVTIKIA